MVTPCGLFRGNGVMLQPCVCVAAMVCAILYASYHVPACRAVSYACWMKKKKQKKKMMMKKKKRVMHVGSCLPVERVRADCL